jgi:hypothetical protein
MTYDEQADAVYESMGWVRRLWDKDHKGRPTAPYKYWFNPNHPNKYARTRPAHPPHLSLEYMEKVEKMLTEKQREKYDIEVNRFRSTRLYGFPNDIEDRSFLAAKKRITFLHAVGKMPATECKYSPDSLDEYRPIRKALRSLRLTFWQLIGR